MGKRSEECTSSAIGTSSCIRCSIPRTYVDAAILCHRQGCVCVHRSASLGTIFTRRRATTRQAPSGSRRPRPSNYLGILIGSRSAAALDAARPTGRRGVSGFARAARPRRYPVSRVAPSDVISYRNSTSWKEIKKFALFSLESESDFGDAEVRACAAGSGRIGFLDALDQHFRISFYTSLYFMIGILTSWTQNFHFGTIPRVKKRLPESYDYTGAALKLSFYNLMNAGAARASVNSVITPLFEEFQIFVSRKISASISTMVALCETACAPVAPGDTHGAAHARRGALQRTTPPAPARRARAA
ncbi:hypothetical protein EVAR_94523_1 [Eumeta japonica]|uniref:Uncharacterized protein n=1 Tax=Eumeta variegata TaxID=151549 RepID=A0A4C1UUV7_EUMVA|nr:hypothetical protein EVAR_94523_1 [Eumeta japonica]